MYYICTCQLKQFFGVVETYFLTNPPELLFSGKSIPLARVKDFLQDHWQVSLKSRKQNILH